MNKIFPLARNNNIVSQDFENEILLYDLPTNKAYCLNRTSALVWQNCDGRKTVGEIAELLSKVFNLTASEDLVWLAIEQLKREDLLANADELPNRFSGMKRREVIRKIGLATMLALPMISSLVAPAAVAAQSGNNRDPNCVACPINEPTTCQTGGSYSIGCFANLNDCSAAAFASGGGSGVGGFPPPNHCCNGYIFSGYNPATGCCTVNCLT